MKRLTLYTIAAALVVILAASLGRASDAVGPGFYNNDLPLLEYTGAWIFNNDASSYQGDHKTAGGTAGDYSVELEFFGSGIALYGWKYQSGTPDAQVCIDTSCFAVSYYAPPPDVVYQQLVFEVTGLDYGVHTFEISNTLAYAEYMSVDAIHIYPFDTLPPTAVVEIEVTAEVIIEITPEATPEWLVTWDGGDGNQVAFEYRADAGQVAGIVLDAALLLVVLLLAFVVMFRGRQESKT